MTNCEKHGHYCPNCDNSFPDPDSLNNRIAELERYTVAQDAAIKQQGEENDALIGHLRLAVGALKMHHGLKTEDRLSAAEWQMRTATAEGKVKTLIAERDALRTALEQSVHFQSHYACLLNMYDGGSRMIFKDADGWLARLAGIIKTEGQKDT